MCTDKICPINAKHQHSVALSLSLSCTYTSFAMLSVGFNTMHFCLSLKWIPISNEPNISREVTIEVVFCLNLLGFNSSFFPRRQIVLKVKLSMNQITALSRHYIINTELLDVHYGYLFKISSFAQNVQTLGRLKKFPDLLGKQFAS